MKIESGDEEVDVQLDQSLQVEAEFPVQKPPQTHHKENGSTNIQKEVKEHRRRFTGASFAFKSDLMESLPRPQASKNASHEAIPHYPLLPPRNAF